MAVIVYGEILLAENCIVGGVLLYITAEALHIGWDRKAAKLRLAAGSLMCGLFSLIIFLRVPMALSLLMEAAFALAVCVVTFGRRRLWHKALAFLITTYVMGGACMALLIATEHQGLYTAVGVYTGDMKAAVLALFMGASLLAAKQIVRVVRKRRLYREHSVTVEVTIGAFRRKVEGFFDTGNGLRDPVTGKPVAVASEAMWKLMQREGALSGERIRLIPYESVGARGLLPAVRADRVAFGGTVIRGCVLARGGSELRVPAGETDECMLLLSGHML